MAGREGGLAQFFAAGKTPFSAREIKGIPTKENLHSRFCQANQREYGKLALAVTGLRHVPILTRPRSLFYSRASSLKVHPLSIQCTFFVHFRLPSPLSYQFTPRIYSPGFPWNPQVFPESTSCRPRIFGIPTKNLTLQVFHHLCH